MKLFLPVFIVFVIFCTQIFCPYLKSQTSIDSLSLTQPDSNDYLAQYKLGINFTINKKYDNALEAYKRSLAIYPRYSEAHFAIYCNEILKDTSLLSELHKEKPSSEKADKIREITEHDDAAFYNDPFFDRMMGGLFIKTEVVYKPVEYIEIYGVEFILINILDGFNKFYHGEYSAAISHLTEMVRESPDFIQAYYFRGLAFAHLKSYQNAISDFQHVIDKLDEYNKTMVLPIYLNSANLHYLIGYAYLQEKRFRAAQKEFKLALEENLGLYMAHFQLSVIDFLEGSYVPALEKIDHAISLKPDDPILHSNKGAFLARIRRFDEAVSEFNIAISMLPRYPALYFNLAQTWENMGKKEEAIENYKKYISSAPLRDSSNVQFVKDRIVILLNK